MNADRQRAVQEASDLLYDAVISCQRLGWELTDLLNALQKHEDISVMHDAIHAIVQLPIRCRVELMAGRPIRHLQQLINQKEESDGRDL